MARILLAGVPRSGTSWTGSALGLAAGVRYVNEPDGFHRAFSFKAMMELGENPRLEAGESAPVYDRLWSGAFAGGLAPTGLVGRVGEYAYRRAGTPARQVARAGGRVAPWLRMSLRTARPAGPDPAARHVLVKSVQCAWSIEWLADRFDPVVIVLARHPLNTIASWKEMDFVRNPREHAALTAEAASRWGAAAPPPTAPRIAHQAFEYAALASALADAAARHPAWIVANHEELCRDAPSELRALAKRVGLEWTDAAERFVRQSDREGTGFDTARVTSEQPDRWRERLSHEDVELIRRVLAEFPLPSISDC